MTKISFYIVIICCFLSFNVFSLNNDISLIQDTEIEEFIREITKPILQSAHLNYKNTKFYFIDDNSINAFVTNGENIFINTGLFTRLDTPDAILGILSHEIGHISAGHIIRFSEKIDSLQNINIGSILLGIGALISGVPELAQAIMLGSMNILQQSALIYSREQEEIADKMAMNFLNQNNLSASALSHSINKFYLNELDYSNNTEYFLTHPLSRNRKRIIDNHIKNENHKFDNTYFNKKYWDKFNFIKAKIVAYNFLQNRNNGSMLKNKNNTDYYLYYESIINMTNNSQISISNLNYLINKYKNIPFFYETLGDVFLKKNNVEEALKNYIIADKMIKNNILIKEVISYLIIKYKKTELYSIAINNINLILDKDNKNIGLYKLLAEIYYNTNKLDLFYFNMAKYFLNDKKKSAHYINLAKKQTTDKKLLQKIEDFELSI